MRKILTHILLIIIPTVTFGQLFPPVSDFNGEIEMVKEKQYGKGLYLFNTITGIYLPRIYSGWKYYYYFNNDNRLNRRINKYRNQVRADYSYYYETRPNRIIEREIEMDLVNNSKGNYIEDEYTINKDGRITKVNIWSFHANDSTKEILAIEINVKYDSLNRLTSFTRHTINNKGDTTDGDYYNIIYDSISQVSQVDKKALITNTIWAKSETKQGAFVFCKDSISEPKLLQRWLFSYNSSGEISEYKTEYHGDIYKLPDHIQENIIQYFKYDKNHNWIKWQRRTGDSKKRLIAKRKIIYK